MKHIPKHMILNPPLYVFGDTSHPSKEERWERRTCDHHPPLPWTLFSNSAYSWFWEYYFLEDLYIVQL